MAVSASSASRAHSTVAELLFLIRNAIAEQGILHGSYVIGIVEKLRRYQFQL